MIRTILRYWSVLFSLAGLAAATQLSAATFVVNSAVDSHDAIPGDGYASDWPDPGAGFTTLRAALEEAGALLGPDTIEVPTAFSPVQPTLGALVIDANGTLLRGTGGYTIIDGIYNRPNHASLVVTGDSCVISSLTIRRSRGDAILLQGSHNQLGGSTVAERIIFIDNNIDNPEAAAIHISGQGATENIVTGCYLGLTPGGMVSGPNRHGILIDGQASGNQIGGKSETERNIISGNLGYGLILRNGAHNNRVEGNFIGPDSTGVSGPGNSQGGLLITSEAINNYIGSEGFPHGNLISANPGHGIELSGPGVTGNVINGNLIGTDLSGLDYLSNTGDGIRLSGSANNNVIGGATDSSGNLISGNGSNGLALVGPGVNYNRITANWIGIGFTGYHWLGNGWIEGNGILLDDGPQNNTIGGLTVEERNVVSANYGFGIYLRGSGCMLNEIRGNYIGVTSSATSSLGNVAGVVITDGANSNTVGGPTSGYGNVISGNRSGEFPFGVGVLIFGDGSDYNRISANIIGLSGDGTRALRNGSTGILIGGGAQHNTVGGDNIADGNVISGNGLGDPLESRAAGVHLFGIGTSFNRVMGNVIGLDPTKQITIGNVGHGIGLFAGASYNQIGGQDWREGNVLSGSEGAGVYLEGAETKNNLLRHNIMYTNDGLGIDLENGAQANIWPPQLTQVGLLSVPGSRLVEGRDAPPDAFIDIYEVLSLDPSGAGEGGIWRGTTNANANGYFSFYLPYSAAGPITLTATSMDAEFNTSEFAINLSSPDVTGVQSDETILPLEFSLKQNYPNPFNPTTIIEFDLPRSTVVTLTILNSLGQTVSTLYNQTLPPGRHRLTWDGTDDSGQSVASGIYLYRVTTDDKTATRKMILLK